jgi:hypothetical protein
MVMQRPRKSPISASVILGFPTFLGSKLAFPQEFVLFNEDTSALDHWPQSRLGQSKKRCLQKVENKESRQRATQG